jgi:hypothetical protein
MVPFLQYTEQNETSLRYSLANHIGILCMFINNKCTFENLIVLHPLIRTFQVFSEGSRVFFIILIINAFPTNEDVHISNIETEEK